MSDPKQYGNRSPVALDKAGGYYFRHVLAMTAEKLHAKSDIAAELAWRDCEIDRLHEFDLDHRREIERLRAELADARSAANEMLDQRGRAVAQRDALCALAVLGRDALLAIFEAVNEGTWDIDHDEDCPQDDTGDCPACVTALVANTAYAKLRSGLAKFGD